MLNLFFRCKILKRRKRISIWYNEREEKINMKYSGIGGQAVIEGIMMKNKQEYAIAVRKPDGQIEVKKDQYISMTDKVKFFLYLL